MKITYSSDKINSFGGINFADRIIDNASTYETIDQILGQRGVKANYSYSDLFRSYLLMTLCGGECAEDITEHLRSELGIFGSSFGFHRREPVGIEATKAWSLRRTKNHLRTECVLINTYDKSNISA